MELERRIEQLERQQAETEQKRQLQVLEHMALRAATVELWALIASSSADQRTQAKWQAAGRLTNYLIAGCYPKPAAEEALTALEDLFYEIDAAQSAVDRPAGNA